MDNEKLGKIRGWVATAALLAMGVFGGSPASAVPITIDFTEGSWLAAQGQSTYSRTYGLVEVTVSATGPMTFNSHEAPDAPVSDLALDGDGIGIGDDEISWGERIDIYFSRPVTVLAYHFLDLFAGEGPNGGGELATVVFDSTTSFVDEGYDVGGFGHYTRDLSGASIVTTVISFIAGLADSVGNFKFSDFALAGIVIDDGTAAVTLPVDEGTEPVAVPEPQPAALFALGLLGLTLLRARSAAPRYARRLVEVARPRS